MVFLRNTCKPEKKRFARALRKNPTEAEAYLWQALRRYGLGVRTVRQSVIRGYIVDFYVPQWQLAIEVDGEIHDSEEQCMKDQLRDRNIWRATGILVMRFKNKHVFHERDLVVQNIKKIGKPREVTKRGKPRRNRNAMPAETETF